MSIVKINCIEYFCSNKIINDEVEEQCMYSELNSAKNEVEAIMHAYEIAQARGAICFRTFDIISELKHQELTQKEPSGRNISPFIFLGKRISSQEFAKKYGESYRFKRFISMLNEKNIASICVCANGQIIPLSDDDLTIEEIIDNNKKSSEEKEIAAMSMFEKLKAHTDEEIHCKYFRLGNMIPMTGKLENVRDFFHIFVYGHGYIHFTGHDTQISLITSKDGEVLYKNPFLLSHLSVDSDADIFNMRVSIFGLSMAEELYHELDGHEKPEKRTELVK